MRRAMFPGKLRKPALTQWTSCIGGPRSLPPRLATPAQKRVPRPTHSENPTPFGDRWYPWERSHILSTRGSAWRGKEECQEPIVRTKRYGQRSLSANGPSGPQARRDEGLQCFDRLPRGLRRWTSATKTHAVVARSSPPQNEATVANFLQQDPLGHTGPCSPDLLDLPTKHVRLRRVRIVQGSRANRLQDDHDGLDLLRGFSGIREQLFAETRKAR